MQLPATNYKDKPIWLINIIVVEGVQQFLSKKDRLGEIPYLNELWAIWNAQGWSEKLKSRQVHWQGGFLINRVHHKCNHHKVEQVLNFFKEFFLLNKIRFLLNKMQKNAFEPRWEKHSFPMSSGPIETVMVAPTSWGHFWCIDDADF